MTLKTLLEEIELEGSFVVNYDTGWYWNNDLPRHWWDYHVKRMDFSDDVPVIRLANGIQF